MARCLVTGGAGFIGSHLTERLLELGHDVVVLDNLSTGRAANLVHLEGHARLTIRVGSITDPVLLAEVTTGTDVIYHMAAAVGVKLVADDPVRTIETNIYPTEVLLRLAAQGKQRVFLASTSEVYGKNPKERWTEEDDLAAALGLRMLEGDRRVLGAGLLPQVRAEGGDRPVLQCRRAATSRPLRHGDPQIRRSGFERRSRRGL